MLGCTICRPVSMERTNPIPVGGPTLGEARASFWLAVTPKHGNVTRLGTVSAAIKIRDAR